MTNNCREKFQRSAGLADGFNTTGEVSTSGKLLFLLKQCVCSVAAAVVAALVQLDVMVLKGE